VEKTSVPLRRLIQALLHLHDTPERTAAAFALGVFFGFSPFIGLQILLSMSMAFALRLNRAAVFIGLNANLPWFLVPWYTLTTLAAAWLLGMSVPVDLGDQVRLLFSMNPFTTAFWMQAGTILRPLVWPILIGPTIGAALVGLVTYPVARAVLRRRAHRRDADVHRADH
jgi:uncharacterized protein (DUF2062 family)